MARACGMTLRLGHAIRLERRARAARSNAPGLYHGRVAPGTGSSLRGPRLLLGMRAVAPALARRIRTCLVGHAGFRSPEAGYVQIWRKGEVSGCVSRWRVEKPAKRSCRRIRTSSTAPRVSRVGAVRAAPDRWRSRPKDCRD